MPDDIKLYILARKEFKKISNISHPNITYQSTKETETLLIDTFNDDEIDIELLKKSNL